MGQFMCPRMCLGLKTLPSTIILSSSQRWSLNPRLRCLDIVVHLGFGVFCCDGTFRIKNKQSPCAIYHPIHSPFSILLCERKDELGGSVGCGHWEQGQEVGRKDEREAGLFIPLVSSPNGHSSCQVATLLPLTVPSGPEVVMGPTITSPGALHSPFLQFLL